MELKLLYGAEPVQGSIDWGRCLGVLDIAEGPSTHDAEEIIQQAILHPIGLEQDIFQIVQPGETVAILVSDSFRETKADLILPFLIEGLNARGIRDEDIFFVFATGTHRAPNPDEQAHILGQAMYERFRGRACLHDPRDEANLVEVGVTSRGTHMRINRRVHEADRIISTGAVVLHYFGGFGGGRKSILPGISAIDTISHNHAMNLDPNEDRINPDVRIGAMEGNPVAEDMLEAAKLVHVDYIINTVLDRHGQIAAVFAGELDAAHRAATEYAWRLYALPIREQASLVIASSGPARNFVQCHKALYNAYQAVKPDGRIIFLCQCREGLGGEQFVKWLRLGSREAIIAGLRQHSEINGQTALSTIQKSPIALLVTNMGEAEVGLLGARKAASLDAALDMARAELPENPTYYVMPSAAYTVPFLE